MIGHQDGAPHRFRYDETKTTPTTTPLRLCHRRHYILLLHHTSVYLRLLGRLLLPWPHHYYYFPVCALYYSFASYFHYILHLMLARKKSCGMTEFFHWRPSLLLLIVNCSISLPLNHTSSTKHPQTNTSQ